MEKPRGATHVQHDLPIELAMLVFVYFTLILHVQQSTHSQCLLFCQSWIGARLSSHVGTTAMPSMITTRA
eukprot:1617248-Amphidinium_carterae.1